MRKEKNSTWPNVTFTIATFNSGRTIRKCLSSIFKQDYSSHIEVVLADGGSTDETLEVVNEFRVRVVNVDKGKQGAEYNKSIAVLNAKYEVLVFIDHDNILPHKKWLKNMVRPLMENPEVIGSAVLKFQYDKQLSLLDRYFALFGATDPVAFYFNKSAHQSYLYDDFHLKAKVIQEKSDYFVTELDPQNSPALGGNGALLRKKFISFTNSKPDFFYHIDIHIDLLEKGFKRYVFVKESIKHLTDNKLIPFLKRRKFYIEKYFFQDFARRRYSIYVPQKDKLLLFSYILYSLSIVFPLIHSIKGYLKIRDIAWFIHPLMCLGMLFVYGYPVLKEGFKHVFLGK